MQLHYQLCEWIAFTPCTPSDMRKSPPIFLIRKCINKRIRITCMQKKVRIPTWCECIRFGECIIRTSAKIADIPLPPPPAATAKG
mmetsp:Transcript_90634/g.132568  ORF Transcript_90634/g.132568 Transcript_90634/m.132568 type:complete len:85 (+) Transcript_90634:720-974(+)